MSPARKQLTRDQIVTAAIALIEQDGADAFTMRRLGAKLGVDPMAVYYHLPNKAAVFDAVVDAIWADLAPPTTAPGGSWRPIIIAVVRALRHQLAAHPRLIPVLATRPAVTPNLLRLSDQAVGRLADAGLAPASAMRLLDCVVGYTVGKVLQEVREPIGGVGVPPEEVYGAITPQTHPHLATAMASGYGWDPEGEFEAGLEALVQGWAAEGIRTKTGEA